MNNTAGQDMHEKVRKLLAKAASVAGTPEAETFENKAFAIMAKYAIDAAQLRKDNNEEPVVIERLEFPIVGAYSGEQIRLLNALAGAVHCSVLRENRAGSVRVLAWGTPANLERLRLLFAMLMPQMLAGASRVRPPYGSQTGVKAFRSSWMRGFHGEITRRLSAAETQAVQESKPGAALVLLDDAKRAKLAMKEQYGGKIKYTRPKLRYDSSAAQQGASAGARVDLGQTGIGSRRALGR